MTLHHLDLADAATGPAHQPDTGFELGWDYAHYGTVPPADHLHPLSPVRQGWEAGRDSFGRRTLQANRFARKWLQLRLNAWLRGRAFEGQQVNPAFLRQIDVAVCPVTREVLTHGTGELSDASVDRVFNDAAYAAGNLAVMSTRANHAKSRLRSRRRDGVRAADRGRAARPDRRPDRRALGAHRGAHVIRDTDAARQGRQSSAPGVAAQPAAGAEPGAVAAGNAEPAVHSAGTLGAALRWRV
ncbi:MAG: hypothetical protein IPJ08_20510 [Burkholderiales bacterium]|nr:hypothetical protein [Burkholderiales bacterium]